MGRGSTKNWTRQKWEKETRKDFQKARVYESAIDGLCQCVTCGVKKPPNSQGMHGGHFIHNNAATRFEEINVNPQCYQCNHFHSGRPLEYEQFMITTYGQEAVDRLRERQKTIKVWTIVELQPMRAGYRKRWKAAISGDQS